MPGLGSHGWETQHSLGMGVFISSIQHPLSLLVPSLLWPRWGPVFVLFSNLGSQSWRSPVWCPALSLVQDLG